MKVQRWYCSKVGTRKIKQFTTQYTIEQIIEHFLCVPICLVYFWIKNEILLKTKKILGFAKNYHT